MKTGNVILLVVMIIAVAAMVFIPVLYDLPDNTIIWNEIQNTGHTPLFGIVALLLFAISLRIMGNRLIKRQALYAAAFIVACLLGAITEFAQIDGPRDADLWDFLRDAAGAGSFLGIAMYFDSDLRKRWPRMTTRFRKTVLLLSVLVLIGSLVPLTLCSGSYLHRNSTFPVICDFDSYWGKRFLTTESARLKIVSPPSAMKSAIGEVGQLNLRAGEYPGFGIKEPYPDWMDYRTLRADVYSPLDTAVNIRVRVEDAYHDGDLTDRFNRTLSIAPGENQIVIPLPDIRLAPDGREMDTGAIAALHFFAVGLQRPITLYFDNIRLQ